jgi:hypothetical protein
VITAERIHGDDTTVPVLAKGRTITGRLWTYVRDDQPFAGRAPPAAVFFYSRDRSGGHPNQHLAGYAGILQADAYAGFNDLYAPARKPGPVMEAACWAHGRRRFFELAELARAPLAMEAVRRIDAIFDVERSINGMPPSQRVAVRRRMWLRWSRLWRAGCETPEAGCRGTPMSPRRSTTCSSAGKPSRGSSTTVGSA